MQHGILDSDIESEAEWKYMSYVYNDRHEYKRELNVMFLIVAKTIAANKYTYYLCFSSLELNHRTYRKIILT